MADVHEPAVRSFNMSQIRAKNTKPELYVRKFLFKQGFRFRLHDRKLPGKPDLVLKKYNTVIFIHGCFWHGHEGCRYFILPKTNPEFWIKKIEGNKERDKLALKKLQRGKWKVIEIWECDIKSYDRDRILKRLVKRITI